MNPSRTFGSSRQKMEQALRLRQLWLASLSTLFSPSTPPRPADSVPNSVGSWGERGPRETLVWAGHDPKVVQHIKCLVHID